MGTITCVVLDGAGNVPVYGRSLMEAFLPEQLSLSGFEPHLDTKELCPEVVWFYRLTLSQGFAAFWYMLCVGSSVPLSLGSSYQSTSCCLSEKNLLSILLRSAFVQQNHL